MFDQKPMKQYNDDQIKLVLYKRFGQERKYGIDKTYLFDIVLSQTNDIIGQCDIRFGSGWYLYYLGNIGYSIYFPYRGNRYATKACRLLLALAKDEGVKELIITCSPENIASYKTITALPVDYIDTVDVPREHDLYQRNEVKKCIFRISL